VKYKVFYHPRSKNFLKKIAKTDFDDLLKKLALLERNPFDKSLDIKKLAVKGDFYRMRYRKIRVIYQVEKMKKIVYVFEIDFRGNVY